MRRAAATDKADAGAAPRRLPLHELNKDEASRKTLALGRKRESVARAARFSFHRARLAATAMVPWSSARIAARLDISPCRKTKSESLRTSLERASRPG